MKLTWPKRFRSSEPVAEAQAETMPPAEPLLIDADLLSDVGCVRTNNEDNGRIVRDPGSDPGQHRLLAIVADGMGGHNAGEIASALAAETIEAAFPEFGADPARQLQHAVIAANARIYAESENNSDRNGMGTTCTVLLIQGNQAYSAHVGDSRLYLLRNGGMYLVTEDHSQVFEMVKAGVLTLQEARHHPDKNVITRALGRQPQVEVAIWPQPMPVQAGDGFLLCSDGLCDVLEDDEMNTVASAHNAADACEELVRLAKSRNASDNITVAVIKLLPLNKVSATAAEPEPVLSSSNGGSRPTRRVEMQS
jgi:PPM family protein phosphatase